MLFHKKMKNKPVGQLGRVLLVAVPSLALGVARKKSLQKCMVRVCSGCDVELMPDVWVQVMRWDIWLGVYKSHLPLLAWRRT